MRLALLLAGLLGTLLFVTRVAVPTLASAPQTTQATYFANGQIRSSTTFVDGTRHGEAREWHPDGALASEGSFREGVREGAWTFWTADGSVDSSRTGVYVGGKLAAVDGVVQAGTR